MRKDRLIALINYECGNSRTRYKDFSEKTGISKETLRAICDGRQRINEEIEDKIIGLYPQYKMWFVFGETYPELGQLSPDIEEVRQTQEG